MSADRLSYPTSLPSPSAALLSCLRIGRHVRRAPRALLARKRELLHTEIGRVVYYTSAHERVSARERPLLLLHGMHLHADAHNWLHLFDAFRGYRHTYAPDLPGFGESASARVDYDPELYALTIRQLIELCASEASAPVDVVAVGLTSEYAARAVAALPDMVSTLTLIDPTGFASERQESVLERMARSGTTFLPFSLLERLGLGRLCSGGFASVLNGIAFPKGNPQAAYTNVHCPTLVLHARAKKARYGTLARFVRWREHYQESEIESTSLTDRAATASLQANMARFFAHDTRDLKQLSLRAG